MSIFVSIAAYRDPECVPTLRNLLAQAAEPHKLRIVICLQEARADLARISAELEDIARGDGAESRASLMIIPVDAAHSQGCCWARAEIQKYLRDDDAYALQIDSHMRFAFRWDEQLRAMHAQLGSTKALLSAYAPPYDPAHPAKAPRKPCRITALRFTDAGTVAFAPQYMRGADLGAPLRSLFFSGHFCFGAADWMREVPYDAKLYFAGEEDTMSARLFTHGWDIYAPHRALLWHHYSRAKRAKHWDDHESWWRQNERALARVARILGGYELGAGGLGETRSAAEYASESGIFRSATRESLAHWALHGYARSSLSTQRDADADAEQWIHADGGFARTEHGWREYELIAATLKHVADFVELTPQHAKGVSPAPLCLFDTKRNLTVRINGNTCEFRVGADAFRTLYTGHWVRTSTRAPPKRASTPPREKQEPYALICDID